MARDGKNSVRWMIFRTRFHAMAVSWIGGVLHPPESRRPQHSCNRRRQPRPSTALDRQLAPSGSGEAVVLRALVAIAGLPGRVDPALALEPVQRGVERAVVDVQYFIRARTEGDADAVAVLRPPLQRAEDQEIER